MILVVFTCSALLTAAQTKLKSPVIKAAAFFQQPMTGTQRVDEDGKPIYDRPPAVHFIVLELKGKQEPVVDSLFYFGNYYPCTVYGVSNNNWVIGKLKKNGRNASWVVSPANSIWVVEFTGATMQTAKQPIIRFKGKTKLQKFSVSLAKEEELQIMHAE